MDTDHLSPNKFNMIFICLRFLHDFLVSIRFLSAIITNFTNYGILTAWRSGEFLSTVQNEHRCVRVNMRPICVSRFECS